MAFLDRNNPKRISYLVALMAYIYIGFDERFYRLGDGVCYTRCQRKELLKLLRMTSYCSVSNTSYVRIDSSSPKGAIYKRLDGDIIYWSDRSRTTQIIDMDNIRAIFGDTIFEEVIKAFSNSTISASIATGDTYYIDAISNLIDKELPIDIDSILNYRQ